MSSPPGMLARLYRTALLVPAAVRKGGGVGGMLRRAVQIFRDKGFKGVMRSAGVLAQGGGPPLMADPSRPDRLQYREWIKRYDLPLADDVRRTLAADLAQWPECPRFVVVLDARQAGEAPLARAVQSLSVQSFGAWRCIAFCDAGDDRRQAWLRVLAQAEPRVAIASGAAGETVELRHGEWLSLLDGRDALAPDALLRLARALRDHPGAQIVYTDEDRIADDGARSAGYFKPAWNPDLARSQDYLGRLGAFEGGLVGRAGGFRLGGDEAAGYDLALRCADAAGEDAGRIVHVPSVLYHRHVHDAARPDAMDPAEYAPQGGEAALQAHLDRHGWLARAERDAPGFRVRYALPDPAPLVTLIIPTRNGLALVRQCIDSILDKTDYPHYEIVLVDNGSDDPQALAYFEQLKQHPKLRVLRDDSPFNYSALNNQAAAVARGEVLGLINNDIEVISPGWLGEMVSIALQPGVGAVGARLWYPNGTLQHGGVVLGYRRGVADHAHRHLPQGEPGYFGRAALLQTFSAVTAACLVVRKDRFDAVGRLDEEHLKVAFNDVDLCLRLREAGWRNVWTPYADLYHHESATRPSDLRPEQVERFKREEQFMFDRWGELLFNDPAYSPNLTMAQEDFSLAWPPREAAKGFGR
ncbi:glycosyltransferase family 2 protein [Xenophilus azovorans]|uniref:glycosyltransferase family 2 protein n=1 Tax=Xenophilus azovorans TaxID=151755 RepID=UPI000B0C58DA|nr:glycosyltransferase family 2 protein [Xenophilus azovorans]